MLKNVRLNLIVAIIAFLILVLFDLNRLFLKFDHVPWSFLQTIIVAIIGSVSIILTRYFFSAIYYIGYFCGGMFHLEILLIFSIIGIILELLKRIYLLEKNNVENWKNFLLDMIMSVKLKNIPIAIVVFSIYVYFELIYNYQGISTDVIHLILSGFIPFYVWKAVFIALIGAAPIVWRRYLFSGIYLIGYLIGFVGGRIVTYSEGLYQTMSGGMFHLFVVIMVIIIGLLAELLRYLYVKK